MESMVSRSRFSLWPYSAAQHPVQCRLQALVGSRRIAHGTLQLFCAATSSCLALPFKLAFTIKFWKNTFRTPGSSWYRFMISLYQLLSVSWIALRMASLWLLYQSCGVNLSTSSISFGMFVSGSFSRYSNAFVTAPSIAACFALSISFIMLLL